MALLSEALYGLSTERLRALLRTRKVEPGRLGLSSDKRQLAQALSRELSQPHSVRAAILQCSARALRLLQLLLIGEANHIVPWEMVVEAAGGSGLSEALSEVLTQLEDLGLAFRMGEGVFLPEAVRMHVPASLPDRHPLARCLQAYDVLTLRRLCDRLGLQPESETKADVIDAIRAHLLDSKTGLRLVCPLDDEERAVLEYLVQMNGVATALEVASAVLGGRTDDFFRYAWQDRWKQGRERNAVDRLLARGIVHVVAHGYGFNLFLIIPGDLLRALSGGADRRFWMGPPTAPAPLPAPPPTVTRHTTLVRDVVSLMAFLAVQEATRTNTGHIHRTSLKNLARTLSLPDERYAGFLYAVCREAHLIAPQGERLVYARTERGEAWLQEDGVAQTHALLAAWKEGTAWAEMYADPLCRSDDYRPEEAVVRMRHAALEILTESGAERFLEIGSVADTLAFRYPLLLTHSGMFGQDLVPSPAAFVRLLVGECLFWLGLAELGWPEGAGTPNGVAAKTKAGRPGTGRTPARGEAAEKAAPPEATAYRLTPLGAFLLGAPGAEAPPETPHEDRFVVQANAEIFVPPYLEPALLYRLLTVTEIPVKGAMGSTVSLTRDSIRRALDKGESTPALLAFLRTHSRTDIPQNVEYLLQEVGGRHGHIHIGRAQMYLQVDSPLLLQELQARRELKPYFVRALSDTIAILQAEDPDKLLRELRKAGYLPVSDDAPVEPVRKSVSPPPMILASSRTPAQQSRSEVSIDSVLDWQRIAQDDGKPWKPGVVPGDRTERQGTLPNDALRGHKAIRVLLSLAIERRQCVEIAYQGQEDIAPITRIIEPRRLLGGFVNAYCRRNQRHDSFNIERIQWGRLLDERYSDGK